MTSWSWRSIARGVHSLAVTAFGNALPGRRASRRSRGSYRQVSKRALTVRLRGEPGGLCSRNTLSLARPLTCLRTVPVRFRGHVGQAEADSKMSRQREMRGGEGRGFLSHRMWVTTEHGHRA
jgi:hypothetical protein